MSQQGFGLCWNTEEVSSTASEGMVLLKEQGQAGEKQLNPSFFHYAAEGVAQIKGVTFLPQDMD